MYTYYILYISLNYFLFSVTHTEIEEGERAQLALLKVSDESDAGCFDKSLDGKVD